MLVQPLDPRLNSQQQTQQEKLLICNRKQPLYQQTDSQIKKAITNLCILCKLTLQRGVTGTARIQ